MRVVAAMYFAPAPEDEMRETRVPMLATSVAIMALATIAAGIFSGQVFDLAQNWINAFSTTVAMR